ncbi:MAG: HIT domain-containing protein [Deferrisomatales bacterium]
MTRRILWAPWRIEYIRAPKDGECVFCAARDDGDDRARLVLLRGRQAFLVLNRYPYTSGHLMVVPNRHVAAPEDCTAEEAAELWSLMVRAKQALGEALSPQGFNVGFNVGKAAGAGIKDHLHLHVVPRWVGDTNFMPVLGDVRVVSQHLEETYDQLAARLPASGGSGTPSPESGPRGSSR